MSYRENTRPDRGTIYRVEECGRGGWYVLADYPTLSRAMEFALTHALDFQQYAHRISTVPTGRGGAVWYRAAGSAL